MDQAAVRSEVVVLLLLIHCCLLVPLLGSMFVALFCVLSSSIFILMGTRELVALLCLTSWCPVIVIVLWLFLKVPWVGLQCVILVFLDHTHLLAKWRGDLDHPTDLPHKIADIVNC